jgi:hypothetical protein
MVRVGKATPVAANALTKLRLLVVVRSFGEFLTGAMLVLLVMGSPSQHATCKTTGRIRELMELRSGGGCCNPGTTRGPVMLVF